MGQQVLADWEPTLAELRESLATMRREYERLTAESADEMRLERLAAAIQCQEALIQALTEEQRTGTHTKSLSS